MSVTIFTDASVIKRHGVAGWGGWAKADNNHAITSSGPLPYDENSTTAELRAIANFTWWLKRINYLKPQPDFVMLQSDSVEALIAIAKVMPNATHSQRDNGVCLSTWRQRNPIRPEWEPAAEKIKEILEGQNVILRHVRGHQEGGGRNWVNRKCDELAKKAAWAGVEQ